MAEIEMRKKKWWFGIGVAAIFIVFFLVLDFATSGSISWSIWPIGAILFFWVAFALLNKFGRE